MKNIFNKLKFVAVAVLALSISSCEPLIDDEATDFGTGPNLVGFPSATFTMSAEANGTEYQQNIPIQIIGPSVANINEDITVNVAVDPSSTAVEGVHYRLGSTTVVLSLQDSDEDVFSGNLPITILTEGIQAPLDEAPVLKLNITDASAGGANVVVNNKTENASVNLAYTCPYNINDYEGTYLASVDEFGIYIGDPVPFEVVAGPGENQLTLVNFASHPEAYDLVIDVDPATGGITFPKQVAINTDNIGYTYGDLSMEGTTGSSGPTAGFCIGRIEFTANYTVGAGSFGPYTTAFEKVPADSGDTGEGEETEGESTDGADTGDTQGEA